MEEDKISHLPKEVVGKILSLLPTKASVATSVLSRSWAEHWRGIDKIDINYGPPEVDRLEAFEAFIHRVLAQCDSPKVHEFTLTCHRHIGVRCLGACAMFAATREVPRVTLDVRLGQAYELPLAFLTSNSLENLKIITDCTLILPPINNYFPNIRVLHVEFQITDPAFCEKFFRVCPHLEELYINVIDNVGDVWDAKFNIAGDFLRRLSVAVPDTIADFTFEVLAPELEYFTLTDPGFACIFADDSFPKTTKVVELHVGVKREQLPGLTDPREPIVQRIFRLLNVFANAEQMILSRTTMDYIAFLSRFPSFPALRSLEASIHIVCVSELLGNLLRATPTLETLLLEIDKEGVGSRDVDFAVRYAKPWIIPSCTTSQLKAMEIRSFGGHFIEIDLIKIVLLEARYCRRFLFNVLVGVLKGSFQQL